jgi:hypothetical protein
MDQGISDGNMNWSEMKQQGKVNLNVW